jgi:hypothetical protein
MGKVTDLLYPLKPISESERLSRAYEMTRALEEWKSELPSFLKPTAETLTGQRIFESMCLQFSI